MASQALERVREILIRAGRWRDEADEGEDTLAEKVPELADLYRASVRGVLSLGPRRGQRVVQFYGEAARDPGEEPGFQRPGSGFSLHARQCVPAGDINGLERLARYINRLFEPVLD